jgi:hypothetical protein
LVAKKATQVANLIPSRITFADAAGLKLRFTRHKALSILLHPGNEHAHHAQPDALFSGRWQHPGAACVA